MDALEEDAPGFLVAIDNEDVRGAVVSCSDGRFQTGRAATDDDYIVACAQMARCGGDLVSPPTRSRS